MFPYIDSWSRQDFGYRVIRKGVAYDIIVKKVERGLQGQHDVHSVVDVTLPPGRSGDSGVVSPGYNPAYLVFDFGDGNGPVPAHQHPNGGGWVADTATVEETAFVGPDARVFGEVRVCGNAQVFGTARVSGDAEGYDTNLK